MFFLFLLRRCNPRRDPAVSARKQIAPGWALPVHPIAYSILWSVPVERARHDHVLAVFGWASGSLSCAEGSNRQHSRRRLLPLPVLL